MTMVEHPVVAGLCAAEDAVLALRKVDVTGLSDELLEEMIAAGERLAARQAELGLRLVAEADNRDLGRRMGATSTVAWIRHRFRLRPGTAKGRLELAHRVASAAAAGSEPHDWASNVGSSSAVGAMPATGQALANGAISVDHAQVIASVMRRIPEHVEAEQVAAAEADLARWATRFDPAGLARLGEHLLHVLDSDTLEEDKERQVAKRELRLNERTGRISGRLDTEGMAMLRTALDPLAAPCSARDGTPDPRSAPRRNADALVELARRACDTGDTLPARRVARPHLSITAKIETLRAAACRRDGHQREHEPVAASGVGAAPEFGSVSGAGAGRASGSSAPSGVAAAELAWGGALSAEAVRRIACDAGITRVIVNADSVPLDVGREYRTVTPGQFAALVVRDAGCAFPGCTRPPAWCEAHHIRHWADGGDTCLGNLVLLCGHHHRSIHHRGWEVRLDARGLPEFTPPAWVDPAQRPQRNDRPRDRDGLHTP